MPTVDMSTFEIPVPGPGDLVMPTGAGPGRPGPVRLLHGLPLAGAGGGDIRTEELGAQDIEGIRAEGTRTTMTVPAGTIGNQLPIETVSERWYSPEMQVVVLTRRSDPRFGETVYRLTNIVRAEPSADLFEVPSDYQVEELAPGTPGQRVAPPIR